MIRPAYALINNPTLNPTLQTTAGLGKYLAIFWRSAYIISGVILLMYLIYGGITWLTSAGDKEAVEKSKKVLTNAVIGITILAISFPIIVIVETVLGVDILAPTWPTP